MMIKRLTFIWLTLVMLFLTMSATVKAAPVVNYTNTYDAVSDVWTYETMIFNDTLDFLYDLVIYPTVQPLSGADLTAEGWGMPEIGIDFVHWMADFDADILPGETMGGFSFTYSGNAGDIGSMDYAVTLYPDGIFTHLPSPYVFAGSTSSSPSSVPEPSTLYLIGFGLAGLSLIGRKSFRNTN